MPKKVWIVPCSGIGKSYGSVARESAFIVTEDLRPERTGIIALSRLVPDDSDVRADIRGPKSITIDGCKLACAAKGTERYSAKPAASIVVTDLCHVPSGALGSARHLSESGRVAVADVAGEIARSVDRLLAGHREKSADCFSVVQEAPAAATCSCGSGVPVAILEIAGRRVEVLALPPIFDLFRKSGKIPSAGTSIELLESVSVYNSIPADESASWKEVIEREYAAYFAQKAG